MTNCYHAFAKGSKIKRAYYTEVCHWIMKSWDLITPDYMKMAFEINFSILW